MNINEILKGEFNLKNEQIENVIKLIDEGNTIPFIARYRKEMTGEMSDIILRQFNDRLNYLRNLQSRKEDVQRIIGEQGKLTDEIIKNLAKANTLQEVEDIYAPYKQKKRTRATIAKEKGLEPLAQSLLKQDIADINMEASNYINTEKGVENVEDALKGALDIIAEVVSDDAEIRKYIRKLAIDHGIVVTQNTTDEKSVYDMYYDYSEPVRTMASHRVLAINRGEKENFLKVKLEIDNDKVLNYIENKYINKNNSKNKTEILSAIEDSYKRLIFPSIEREIRAYLTENAQERAISVFGENIKNLLLQPPLKGKVVMGFDPGYVNGCKIAVVDRNGKFLDQSIVYPHKPQAKMESAKKTVVDLVKKYDIDVIAIGNGTASRESEKMIADLIKEENLNTQYVIVSEAGASIYSASELAAEEHPDINVSIRGAISIGRRLQDPLAELVKIDPKAIGVGQYQHDVDQKKLTESLTGVVEDAVNEVGVDVNTATPSLLSYVAGINKTIANNIVKYRDENGKLAERKELLKVPKLGKAAFEQCAGFIRIPGGKNALEITGVHPESYSVAENLLNKLGYKKEDLLNKEKQSEIKAKLLEVDVKETAKELDVGEMTLADIIEEMSKPGRDPRDEMPKQILRADVLKFEDLRDGMVLTGTVRNVTDFGAFVDIGVKHDGLVHISQLSNSFVKNPSDVVSVGDIVKVKVIGIDQERQKVQLSMKDA